MRRHELGRPFIAAQTREGETPVPVSSPDEHIRYVECLSSVIMLMRAWTKDKELAAGETARQIAERLVILADHAARDCGLCREPATLRIEAEFLEEELVYLSSAHGKSASSLDGVRVDAPGAHEDETVERWPFGEFSKLLDKKRILDP